jgi:hypothetical protein
MSAIPRKHSVKPGKTAQGLTSFDTANTTGIFRTLSGKNFSSAEESEIVRTATVQLNFPRHNSEFFNCQLWKYCL